MDKYEKAKEVIIEDEVIKECEEEIIVEDEMQKNDFDSENMINHNKNFELQNKTKKVDFTCHENRLNEIESEIIGIVNTYEKNKIIVEGKITFEIKVLFHFQK